MSRQKFQKKRSSQEVPYRINLFGLNPETYQHLGFEGDPRAGKGSINRWLSRTARHELRKRLRSSSGVVGNRRRQVRHPRRSYRSVESGITSLKIRDRFCGQLQFHSTSPNYDVIRTWPYAPCIARSTDLVNNSSAYLRLGSSNIHGQCSDHISERRFPRILMLESSLELTQCESLRCRACQRYQKLEFRIPEMEKHDTKNHATTQ